MSHPKCILTQILRKYFAFSKACILPLLPRDVMCFYKAFFIKCFDHHSHKSTIIGKSGIFHVRTKEQFILEGISREYILQILLKIDQIGWGCPRFSPVKSWLLPRADMEQPPWVTCSSFCWYSWYFFPYFNENLCLFYVSWPTVISGCIFFMPSCPHCT